MGTAIGMKFVGPAQTFICQLILSVLPSHASGSHEERRKSYSPSVYHLSRFLKLPQGVFTHHLQFSEPMSWVAFRQTARNPSHYIISFCQVNKFNIRTSHA